jgi:hypothetical protein
MKKSLLMIAALLMVTGLALADDVYGTSGAPASHQVTITVRIPPRVGIRIDGTEHAKLLDLTGVPWYPPAVGSYRAIGTNLISILSTGNYSYAYTDNAAGLLTGLVEGEFQYSPNGWGVAGWVSFAGAGALEPSTARTGGWIGRNMDYQVYLDGNETAGDNILLVTYTITAQP